MDNILSRRVYSDPVRMALVLLTFLTIGRAHVHFGLGFLRPAVLLAGFVLVYATLNPRSVSDRFLRVWQGWTVPAIGLIALATLPFGIAPGASARYFVDVFSTVLITALLLLVATRGVFDTMHWVVAFVAGCAMQAYYATFVFQLSTTGGGVARLSEGYMYDPNDIGLILVVGLPLCMWLIEARRGAVKVFAGVVLGTSVFAIARTGSRGAFLALAVVGFSMLVIALGRVSIAKRVAAVATIFVLLNVAAPPGYWNQMSTMLSAEEDYNWTSKTGRKAIALRGLGYMSDYPLAGLGLGNFGRAEGTISPMAAAAMPGEGVRWTSPHNSYIQVGAELGLPGGIVFLALVFGSMGGLHLLSRRASRRWGESEDPARRLVMLGGRYLTLSYVGFSIGAFFLTFAYLDVIYILTAMTVGVHLEERRLLAEDAATAVRRRPEPVVRQRGGLALARRANANVDPSTT